MIGKADWGFTQGKFVLIIHSGPRPGFALIPAQAGIQIRLSDHDGKKNGLMKELDSGSSTE